MEKVVKGLVSDIVAEIKEQSQKGSAERLVNG